MTPSQYTFFGDYIALEALTQAGDRLVELDRQVDMPALVAVAHGIWRQSTAPAKGPGGRKPWSCEVMWRVLLLKRLYNLSDEQTEFQLRDRLSFLRFVRLGLGDEVPDSRTIWLYGELLSQADGARKLFDAFHQQLLAQGLIVKVNFYTAAARAAGAALRQAWATQPTPLPIAAAAGSFVHATRREAVRGEVSALLKRLGVPRKYL